MQQCVSLVVVSQNRDDDLCRLVEILKVQHKIKFELVLVTNTPREVVGQALGDHPAKFIYSETENISYLRNLGISAAGYDCIYYCDDDAIPEPDWGVNLVAPLSDPKIGSSTGSVFGRNGFDIQWGMTITDYDGFDLENTTVPDDTVSMAPQNDTFLRAQGTNCAFKKKDLIALGGFDEQFEYFLDETDLTKRLADKGFHSAFVPDARVHHLFAENRFRHGNRVPKSLSKIAQSIRHFANKHSTEPQRVIRRKIGAQIKRVYDALEHGFLEPRDFSKLYSELTSEVEPLSSPKKFFRKDFGEGLFCDSNKARKGVVLAATRLKKDKIDQRAVQSKARGDIVTLLELTYSFRRHKRSARNGIYVQKGGIFGLRDRRTKSTAASFDKCVNESAKEIALFRPVHSIYGNPPIGGPVENINL